MPKEALQGAADYLAKNSRRRIWKRVVGVLICIVVFCTTYALIVPAITMENHTVYCGFEEHQHTPECYEKKLLCGQEEGGSAVHTHTDECYGDDGTLKCGFKEGGETADHVHTEECYEDVLLCGKEEHSHVLLCHSDPTADVESPEDWSASVDGVKLTGSWRIDLLAVAESQLGYKESTRNYTVDGDGQTTKGYTRYGAWYGDSYGNWDAMFVSFCLNFAKVEGFPQESSVSRWAELLQKEEYGFYRAKENYAPRAGDLIFLDTDADRVADRVGLVAELSETAKGQTALRILEGDSENCVQYTEYSPSDEGVLGYGELPKEPQMEYCWSHGGMEIVASVRKSADLPENASLTVRSLSPEDTDSAYGEKYAASQEKIAAENPAEITRFDLFKVYLEADGQEVLPKEEATVEIRLSEKDASAADSTEIFRYSENGAEKVEAELNEASGSLIGSFASTLSGEYAIVDARELAGDPAVQADAAGDEIILTPHKTIDAFRDGDENPDTDLDNQEIDQTDLYRLYLDAQLSGESKPIDLLIVVDQSGSMHNDYQGDDVTAKYQDMTKEGGMDAFRDEALRLVLNGTSNNTDLNEYEKNKQNGLIYQFLAANKENKVAVVGFQGAGYTNGSKKYGIQYGYEKTGDKLADVTSGKLQTDGRNGSVTINVSSGIADTNGYLEAYTILDWTNQAQRVDVQGIPFNATNYTAGFIQAQRELDDATVKNDGRQKVILFLSDGIPTCYIGEGSVLGVSYYYRGGTGNNTERGTDAATNTAFSDFLKANQGTIFHTISIRGNNNNLTEEEKKDAEAAETRLRNMAADGGGQCFSVKTTDDLRANIKKLMFSTVYSELSIQDVLSQYVDLYEKQPDFKVTRKDGDGVETVLYENGAVTDAGNGVVESLLYNGNTKTISVVFNKNYTPAPGTTHTVSYNVQTSRKAYQEYAQKGYQQVTGEKNTDYTGNVNSSSQPGFHSNAQATVTYKTDGAEKPVTAEYPHPVVQVATCKIAVQKTDIRDPERALSDAVFTLYRKAFPEETGETLEGLSGSYIKIAEQLITDTSGQFAVDNLIPGEYCFVETQAPNGYREPFDPVAFTLSRRTDGAGQIEGSNLVVTIGDEILPGLQITNTPLGPELPQTGGNGSVAYIIGGVLLMVSAGMLLLYRKYQRRKEDLASS